MAAYFITSAAAAVFSWVCWPTGLICGAFIAVELGKKVRGIHYPLLVAAAYSGFLVFQMGFTGTHLILATPGTWSEKMVGLVPVTQTMLSPWNLTLSVVIGLIVVPFLITRMAPPKGQVIELVSRTARRRRPPTEEGPQRPAFQRLGEKQLHIQPLLGGGLVVYNIIFCKGRLADHQRHQPDLHDTGLLLTPTPIQYVKRCIEGGARPAASQAVSSVRRHPGHDVTTGLAQVIAGWFVAISTVPPCPCGASSAPASSTCSFPPAAASGACRAPP
jgi:short-chain fatty acids transporter